MAVVINGSGVVTGLNSQGSSDLGTELEAAGGLVMVTPTTIANSGGTATLTNGAVTYSGVTSISLNDVFSSIYQNYRIVLSLTASSSSPEMRYRTAGTDSTGSNYVEQFFRALNTVVTAQLRTRTGHELEIISASSPYAYSGDIFSPFEAVPTSSYLTATNQSGTGATSCRNTLSTSFDGLTIFTLSGTMSGTIRVYGYRNGI